MATNTAPNISSSKLLHNYSSTSACDRPHCSLVNSDIKDLQAEVKSLTEIVNILSNELKMISQQDSNKRTRTSITSEEVDSPTWGNCKKLELKLRTVNDEISSQKLTIELLMDNRQSKPTSQLQQANLKT